MLCNKKAQSTLEYALIISVVVGALLAINVYMRKGIQGRLKQSSDQIGSQFDPDTFTEAWKTESSGTTTTGEIRDVITGSLTTTVSTGETVNVSEEDTWGTAPSQVLE